MLWWLVPNAGIRQLDLEPATVGNRRLRRPRPMATDTKPTTLLSDRSTWPRDGFNGTTQAY